MPDTTPRPMILRVNVHDPDHAKPDEIARQTLLPAGVELTGAHWVHIIHLGLRDDALAWARNEATAMAEAHTSGEDLTLSPVSCDRIAHWLRLLVDLVEAREAHDLADHIADTVAARLTGTIPGQTRLDDYVIPDEEEVYAVSFPSTGHPEIDAMHAISQAMATLPGGDDARRRVAVWAADRYGADA